MHKYYARVLLQSIQGNTVCSKKVKAQTNAVVSPGFDLMLSNRVCMTYTFFISFIPLNLF